MASRMNFGGNVQTTYSEWARTSAQQYPEAQFRKHGLTTMEVVANDKKVAEFDFHEGTGYVMMEGEGVDIRTIPSPPNFEVFDIDKRLLVE